MEEDRYLQLKLVDIVFRNFLERERVGEGGAHRGLPWK